MLKVLSLISTAALFILLIEAVRSAPAPTSSADPKPSVPSIVIFQDNFSTSESWSEWTVTKDPSNGLPYRGPFWSQTNTLSLKHLPRHTWIKVHFKLWIRGTWDGNNRIWGPDLWSLTVRGAQRLIFATICNLGHFAHHNNEQSYPDDFHPFATHPARTGAEGNPLTSNYTPAQDEINKQNVLKGLYTHYPIDLIFPHAEDSLLLDFEGIYDDPEKEQAWGLSEVKVEVLPEAPYLEAALLPDLWNDLASDDPLKANAAIWKLVSGGEVTVRFLTDKITMIESQKNPPVITPAEELRLVRTDRILRLIGGPGLGMLRYRFEKYMLR